VPCPDADAARFRQTLQPRRDVYPVAVNLFAVDDHIAQVHAYPELHPSLGCDARVLNLESSLDLDGAIYRLDHAGEFRQHAVTGRIDESPAVSFYERVDNLAMGRQGAKSRSLIVTHEAAVAINISAEDRGELALHTTRYFSPAFRKSFRKRLLASSSFAPGHEATEYCGLSRVISAA
jgi:hypothetical protein